MSFTKVPKLRFIETRNNTYYIEWINFKENRYNVRAACYFSTQTKGIDNQNYINTCKDLEEHKTFLAAVIRQAKLKHIRYVNWVVHEKYSEGIKEFLEGYGFSLVGHRENSNGIVSKYRRRRYNGN